MNSMGFCKHMVSSLVEIEASILRLHFVNMRNVFDDFKRIVDVEFSGDLLWRVLLFGSEALLEEVQHLGEIIAECSLQLLKGREWAAFETFGFSCFQRHGSDTKSAFNHSFVVSGSKSEQLWRWST
jgi:hypothetical protein